MNSGMRGEPQIPRVRLADFRTCVTTLWTFCCKAMGKVVLRIVACFERLRLFWVSSPTALASIVSGFHEVFMSMCDGYLIVDQHGYIIGTDDRTMRRMIHHGCECLHIDKVFEEKWVCSSVRDKALSVGVTRMVKVNLNDKHDAYAEICEYPLAGLALRWLLTRCVNFSDAATSMSDPAWYGPSWLYVIRWCERTCTKNAKESEVFSSAWSASELSVASTPMSLTSSAARARPARAFETSSNVGPDGTKTWNMIEGAKGLSELGYSFVQRYFARGAFGIVHKLQDGAGNFYALKEVSLLRRGRLWTTDWPLQVRNVDREARSMRRLGRNFPTLALKLHSYWMTTDFSAAFLLIEWLPLSLDNVLKDPRDELRLEEIKRWITQITAGVACIHFLGLLHRDVKPGNILLTENRMCKISDHGYCRDMHADASSDVTERSAAYTAKLGTSAYASPEVLQGDGQYSSGTDIFSLGCVVFELLAKERCFGHSEKSERQDAANLHARLLLRMNERGWNPADSDLAELVGLCFRMISLSPSERPTAAETLRSTEALQRDVESLLVVEPALGNVLDVEA
eukprot:TRINITY_DN27798_c0_g3_i1.p1 TRINITY_DN27798_c0_g3~~TRINITY_DN27798_c0_g3_i1.p1  ORF type:complete len:570 (-),score=40.84 TRINITY_DN27798_c0_g3_i1:190-1899(-)